MTDLKSFVTGTTFTPQEIRERCDLIYGNLISKSRYIRTGNFSSIHPSDLRALFAGYDEHFFEGTLRQEIGALPLRFTLSRRLTSSAGVTKRYKRRFPNRITKVEYEISISSTLLFQSFRDEDRSIVTSGITCNDRVEALQRIFEHELIHLAEMLIWETSNCAASRFQVITRRLFGHREHTHQLITQRERALSKFGLKVGDRVTFEIHGKHRIGIINRITRRATVLVKDRAGQRYNDGEKYLTFYVPLDLLRPSNRDSSSAAG